MPAPRSSSAPPSLSLDAYAALVVALAEGALPREQLLRAQGLDEERWAALDADYQARLSQALDEEHEGVPPLIAAYDEAFARARAAAHPGEARLSLERFADATREIQRRGDPLAALGHLGITLADYLAASAQWTRRMLAEPEIGERFRARLSR